MNKLTLMLTIAISLFLTGLVAQDIKTTQKQTDTKEHKSSSQVGNNLICPVSGEEFVLNKETPKIEVNGKTYYFCCKGCIETFQKNYQKKDQSITDIDAANEMICPVMKTKFIPNSKSPKTEYKGKTYYFCCPECVDKFKKESEKYLPKTKKKCCDEKSKKEHKHEKGKKCDKHKTN